MFGLLNIDKPADLTSRQVVDRVVRLAGTKRVGHAGTLDPIATGVLVLCVGRATRLISYLQQLHKVYTARFLLGCRSDTDDTAGNITSTRPSPEPVPLGMIEGLLPRFLGRVEQVPPQFSAVHIGGHRAYDWARRGNAIPIPPRPVHIHRLTVLAYEYPELELEIECGSGTYVRSIARDLGEFLGIGAVMSRLVRTRVGPFTLENAVSLEELEASGLETCLLPPALAVSHLAWHTCTIEDLSRLRVGRPIARSIARSEFDSTAEPGAPADGEMFAVFSPDGTLACIARYDSSADQLAPRNVFLTPDC